MMELDENNPVHMSYWKAYDSLSNLKKLHRNIWPNRWTTDYKITEFNNDLKMLLNITENSIIEFENNLNLLKNIILAEKSIINEPRMNTLNCEIDIINSCAKIEKENRKPNDELVHAKFFELYDKIMSLVRVYYSIIKNNPNVAANPLVNYDIYNVQL